MKIKKIVTEVVEFDDGTVKEVKELNGTDWARLLQEQPKLIDKADLNKLEGDDWVWLLREQPQFIDKADLNKLEGDDWVWLLQKQPQLKKFKKEVEE